MNNIDVNNHPQATIKRNRFYGVLIIIAIALPMVLAYVMFHTGWGVSLNTTNKGQLINPPLPIKDISLDGNSSAISDLYGDKESAKKWRLLVPVTANCSQACQNNLYVSRQVHIRLAEKAYRVERIILGLETLPLTFTDSLEKDHPNTRRAQTTLPAFSQWLTSAGFSDQAENYYYLVDQEGFAMMRYSTENTGQDLLDDLKKLLKFTYDK